MLSWGVILHGAALSVVVAIALAVLLGRERRPAILVTITAGTLAGSIAWNAIPRRADRRRYFTDAPSGLPGPCPQKECNRGYSAVLRWIWCDGIPISTAGSATNATAHSST